MRATVLSRRVVSIASGPSRSAIGLRRVHLVSGALVLSHAAIAYRVSALPRAFRDELDTGDKPFGAVIAPLNPFRQLTSVTLHAANDGAGCAAADVGFSPVLELRATISTMDSGVIAKVHEVYGSDLIAGLVDGMATGLASDPFETSARH